MFKYLILDKELFAGKNIFPPQLVHNLWQKLVSEKHGPVHEDRQKFILKEG